MSTAEEQPEGSSSPYGRAVAADDPVAFDRAMATAVDYRGDVTLVRHDGTRVDGYVFDRRVGASPAEAVVRLIERDGGARRSVPVADIAELRFSGRDTAAGKSFETWMRKYVEKKLAGEQASIESESLES